MSESESGVSLHSLPFHSPKSIASREVVAPQVFRLQPHCPLSRIMQVAIKMPWLLLPTVVSTWASRGGSQVYPCFPTDPPVNLNVRKVQIIVYIMIVSLKKKKKALFSLISSSCYSSSQIQVKMKKRKPSPSLSNQMKCSVCAHKHWMPLRAQILLLL